MATRSFTVTKQHIEKSVWLLERHIGGSRCMTCPVAFCFNEAGYRNVLVDDTSVELDRGVSIILLHRSVIDWICRFDNSKDPLAEMEEITFELNVPTPLIALVGNRY